MGSPSAAFCHERFRCRHAQTLDVDSLAFHSATLPHCMAARPLHGFSSVQHMRQCQFEARTTGIKTKNHTPRFDSDVTRCEEPGASSNFVI